MRLAAPYILHAAWAGGLRMREQKQCDDPLQWAGAAELGEVVLYS